MLSLVLLAFLLALPWLFYLSLVILAFLWLVYLSLILLAFLLALPWLFYLSLVLPGPPEKLCDLP